MPGRPILLHLVVLLCVVLSGFLLYPYIVERCIDAWDERQVRIAREENAREEEIHRQVDFIVGFYVGPSYRQVSTFTPNDKILDWPC